MGRSLDDLLDLLDLEQLERDLFRGRSPDEQRQRVFGGQVAGQALVAAGRTVPPGSEGRPDRTVHSLHAYFLRPGDPAVPIIYDVDRIRDGRSFTTRRVVAIQHGRAIFNLAASFHVPEPGLEHQDPMPEAPPPESLPSIREVLAAKARGRIPAEWDPGIEQRYCDPESWWNSTPRDPDLLVWLKAAGRLPDDPMLHCCVAAYASDLMLLDTPLLPHGLSWMRQQAFGASLDHAMWFHRAFRADEWFLYAQHSPSATGGLGLATGSMFTRDGRLAVTVMQQGLIRPAGPGGGPAPEPTGRADAAP
jgi:acyl-CoA thioesterase-2